MRFCFCFSSRFILNYLRDSYIGLDSFGEEDLHFLEELSHEAQFFNIAGLCADISRRRVFFLFWFSPTAFAKRYFISQAVLNAILAAACAKRYARVVFALLLLLL